MKKIISSMILVILISSTIMATKIPTDDERKRAFIILGGGYAFARVEGVAGELGAELRLFSKVYARLTVDYHSCGREVFKDGITYTSAVAANLFALYKFRLSETMDFIFKAGGTYTMLKSDVTALGVSFSTDESTIGAALGAGLELQLSNRFYLYLEGTFKYLNSEVPFGWVQTFMGLHYRLK